MEFLDHIEASSAFRLLDCTVFEVQIEMWAGEMAFHGFQKSAHHPKE